MTDPLRLVDHTKHWERVLPEIERGLIRARADLSAQDLYDRLDDEAAYLLLADDGATGVIWTADIDELTGRKTLWVVFAWSRTGRGIESHQDQFMEIAARAGFDRVAFSTVRPGYRTLLKPPWRTASWEYEIPLT